MHVNPAIKALCLAVPFFFLSSASAQPAAVRDSVGQEYRLIEATHFEMGAARAESFRGDHADFNTDGDDQPIHPVILTKPFYMATTEVTVDQFRQFIEATKYPTSAEISDAEMVVWDPVDDPKNDRLMSSFRGDRGASWKEPSIPQTGSHPVVGVSYHDAKAYCRWLSDQERKTYRLPTEAEWECACRANTTTHFSFGDDYQQTIHRYANIGNVELERKAKGRVLLQWLIDVHEDPDDGFVFTAPVASYQANPWGLFDLHGNVWEWCEDRYLDTYYNQFRRDGHHQLRKRAVDPLCDEPWNDHGDWRVIRGGSWFVSPIQCRSGVRGMLEASDAACYLGFRVVREASESQISQSRQRHVKSEAALESLKSVARSMTEARDGHIRIELPCEKLNQAVFDQLADLEYSLEVQIGNPGRLSSEHLVQLSRIQRLAGIIVSVGGEEISANEFAPLADHPEIEQLQITGTVDLDDSLISHFAAADRLTSINLQGDRITDRGLNQFPVLKELHTLHLASTQSQGLFLHRCSGSPLREVSFGQMNDEGAKSLRDFQTLRNVNLRGCPIGSSGLDSIASIRLLETLHLDGCQTLTDEDFHVLAQLDHLANLNLSDTGAGDIAVEALRDSVNLRDLVIGSGSLSNIGMHSICDIVSLQSLTLSEPLSKITDDGLADFWRLVNLQRLTIDATKITGSGFASLAELPNLRQLTLNCPSLTDVAMDHVARMENLGEIFIGDWQSGGPKSLTDAGLMKLAQSPKLTKVTLIRQGTAVSDEAIEEFKKLNPDVRLDVR